MGGAFEFCLRIERVDIRYPDLISLFRSRSITRIENIGVSDMLADSRLLIH
jgi:hypothetical protein